MKHTSTNIQTSSVVRSLAGLYSVVRLVDTLLPT